MINVLMTRTHIHAFERARTHTNTDSDTHTVLHFGQTKVWVEGDWDAAHSFCLLHFSFAASSLSASNSQLAFLTDERQLSRSEASCCHD